MIAEMCGRYALSIPAETLAALFSFTTPEQLEPRFNIAPTQTAPVVRLDRGARELAPLRWGLVPRWAKDLSVGTRMINDRSETADEKPAFRDAFRKRRCLVPASGFYEWKKLDARTKQPYFIQRADGQPAVMAGLWESWNESAASRTVETFTILTTQANDLIRELHDRMPVFLGPDQFERWLDPDYRDVAAMRLLLKPAPAELFTMHAVRRRVNSPSVDDPSLIEPERPDAESNRSTDERFLFD